jgi:2-polyprenyl-3-methyl-5-hydroxy-6-metoxy-1,4-benzoquinol methylase
MMNECRACSSKSIYPAINLGHHPLADRFLSAAEAEQAETFYPLSVSSCGHCGYAGLDYVVPVHERYVATDYSYTAGNSRVSREHFAELAQDISDFKAGFADDDLIVDIGGNDGTFLRAARQCGASRLINVEAAPYAATLSRQADLVTIETVWGAGAVDEPEKLNASVIVTTNVLNHADQPREFIAACAANLRPGGLLVIEVPSLIDLLAKGAWDTIYLEHISYFCGSALYELLAACGLHVIRIEDVSYMGGSLRVWAANWGEPGTVSHRTLSEFERDRTTIKRSTWQALADQAQLERASLTEQIFYARRAGLQTYALGAAAKGNTLLNYCRFDESWITAVADASPHKIGKLTSGSRIPIVPDAAVPAGSSAVILPWNVRDLLKERFADRGLHYLKYREGVV